MPLPKPYPPTEISYANWNDLADHYAGKAATLLVDVSGKGDYANIQEAVDALGSSGGEIVVAEGVYVLSKAVFLDGVEDVVIRGMGKATVFKVANKVQKSLAVDALIGQRVVTVSDGYVFQAGQHVCVRDNSHWEVNTIEEVDGNELTLENPLANDYETSGNGRVYTCHSAVYVAGGSRRVRVTNLFIEGNRANQEFGRTGYYPLEHQGDGVRVSATCEGILIDHCWIKSVVAHGICLGGVGHRVVSCECWDNGYDGINAEPSCDEILIANNYCHDQASWNGVQFGYSTNLTGSCLIIGNVLENNYQGIAAQGGSSVQIIGNMIKNNRFDGIELYNIDRFLVEGNLISGASDLSDMTNEGIHVEQTCSVGLITGNLIEQAAGDGVHVENGAYLTITGNVIRKIVKHGIKFAQTNGRDSTVSGNTIVDCDCNDTETYCGIAVLGDRVAVIGNRIDNCDKYAIHITSTANKCLVVGNQCTVYTGSSLGVIQDEGVGSLVEHNMVA